MDNYNSPLYEAPPEPVQKTLAWPGIVSLIMAVISVVLTCIMFLLFYNVGHMAQGGISIDSNAMTGMSLGAMAMLCGTVTASLVGVGLGIWGTVQKTASKITGIIGLIGNGLILLGLCCFFAFALIVAQGM